MISARASLLALATTTFLSFSAHAGGVITHGREAEGDRTAIGHDTQCDATCHELYDWLSRVYSGRDAIIARQADELGHDEVTIEMLESPESFGMDPAPRGETGCSATGGTVFMALAALGLLRRRRRPSDLT